MRETACTPGVARLNIEHYRNKLATETHEAQRQTLTLGTILTTCWMTEDAPKPPSIGQSEWAARARRSLKFCEMPGLF